MSKVYIIGSLSNSRILDIANRVREEGHEVFADWFAAGAEADEWWQIYETRRGHEFIEALDGPHARHVFEFDKRWLDWADAAVLALPAGKSAHLELGYVIGTGKPGYILLDDEPERWDVMYRFATGVFNALDTLMEVL